MYYISATLLLAIYLYCTVTGATEYKKFKTLKDTEKRQHYYKRWIWEPWVLFGLVSVITLVVLGEAKYIFRPITHMSVVSKSADSSDNSFVIGLVIGLIAAACILYIRVRRSLKHKIAVGNTDALMPRNIPERKLAAHLALASGVGEELFFRAAIPAVMYGISHNATLAFGVSIVLFGLMHIYQGWRGVLATGLAGWVFIKAFTISGTIAAPMALHVLIDTWGLVVVPYVLSRKGTRT